MFAFQMPELKWRLMRITLDLSDTSPQQLWEPLRPSFPGSEPSFSSFPGLHPISWSYHGSLFRRAAQLLNSSSLSGSSEVTLIHALWSVPPDLCPQTGPRELSLVEYKGSSACVEGKRHRYGHMVLQRKHMLLLLNSLPK